MDILSSPVEDTAAPNADGEAERRDRLVWEAEGLAETRAQLDPGLHVDADEINAWIGTDHEFPAPPTRHR